MNRKIVSVRLLRSAKATDREYDYLLPEDLSCKKGDLLRIPFGRSNRENFGIAVGFSDSPPDRELKTVLAVFPPEFSLTDEQMALCDFLRKQIFCTFGDAARAMIPSPVYRKSARSVRCVRLSAPDAEEKLSSFSGKNREKYLSLISYLKEAKIAEAAECEKTFGVSSASLALLQKKGILSFCEKELSRSSFEKLESLPVKPLSLSDEQQRAYEECKELSESGKAACALLYGVTGSGKTSVMLALIRDTLEKGKNVIFLVPEIALTSQSARLLISRYGKKVAVLHSALSDGERHDAFAAIGRGEKRIVLGTRSAVFAPLSDIGLIVIDEEQDQSYKSDTLLKYHARDVARFRAVQNSALLVLASATPDVTSFYKAKEGKYHLIELKSRYGEARLPEAAIVDLKGDLRRDPTRLIGKVLAGEIRKNLDEHEQCILLMNRRGYRKFVSCMQCGAAIRCPDCSVTMTVHGTKSPRLVCHYCGRSSPLPESCPVCGSNRLAQHGYGIQHLEEEIRERFPDARILRMDSDTVTGKGVLDEILTQFQDRKADILIGTQMVAKGHNFPDVTLVGIVFADTSLYSGDYRAIEHTYSLLTQVIGRAGRAEKEGRALIQTLNPRHEVFSLASRQDYEAFYQGEIAMRKTFLFPPFCELGVFTLSDENEPELLKRTKAFADEMSRLLKTEFSDVKLVIYGPFDAPVYKIRGVYRKRFILKYKNNRRTRALFESLLISQSDVRLKNASLSLDINPTII